MSTSFYDPREPWITRGILISLASLFDLCKGLQLEFAGEGQSSIKINNKIHFFVPGKGAEVSARDQNGKPVSFIVDASVFEKSIEDIKDANIELKDAVKWLKGFENKIYVQNLMNTLINYWQYPEIKKKINEFKLQSSIKTFTLNFNEFVDLSSLLKTSYRNREYHKKLGDRTNKAYWDYQHAIMSRFLQLVNECSEYPKSKDWWTRGDQGDAMIINHEEEFNRLTEQVFDWFGKPPLQGSPEELEMETSFQSDTKQVIDLPSNDEALSISKTDLYEIVDFIRETHDESSSRIASLEEQISLLVADTTEDLKSTLLRPWMNKDIEVILSLISSRSADQPGETESSNSSKEEEKAGAQDAHRNNSAIEKVTPTVEQRLENLYTKLRALRNEIRNNLHQINPRFEYYHCVLQSNIVGPALHLGVCSYDQLKETKEFQTRIVKVNGSFMLDVQEKRYKERIDRLLSQNPL